MSEYATVAEAIEDESRWDKYSMTRGAPWCLLFAIYYVYGEGKAVANEAYMRLLNFLHDSGHSRFRNVSAWEMRPERTHAEVLEACRKAGI